jgi:hypothetical protein
MSNAVVTSSSPTTIRRCCISFKHDAFSIVLILKVIFRIPSTTQKERELVPCRCPAHSIQFWISW